MNALIAASTQLTMSSREIAELVESRHDDVKRTIQRLADTKYNDDGSIKRSQVIELPPMAEVKNHLGQTVQEYRLCKRDSLIVVAQLSPEFTARLVDRWQELESKYALPNFNDPVAAARAWADAKESEQKALVQLEHAKPAVQFVDKFVRAECSKGLREVCKLLNANENEFKSFLQNKKIMYRLGGRLTPFGTHLECGRFEVKAGVSKESEHAFTQAKFTPKGVAWIAGLWMEHTLQGGAV